MKNNPFEKYLLKRYIYVISPKIKLFNYLTLIIKVGVGDMGKNISRYISQDYHDNDIYHDMQLIYFSTGSSSCMYIKNK